MLLEHFLKFTSTFSYFYTLSVSFGTEVSLPTPTPSRKALHTTNGHGKCDTHDSREGGGGSEHGQSSIEGWVDEVVSHGTNISCKETSIEGMAAREEEGGRVQQPLQLSVGNQGTTEIEYECMQVMCILGNTSNVWIF